MILSKILFVSSEIGRFPAVTHTIAKLTNAYRRNKVTGNQPVFEDIYDSFAILSVGLLAPNGFHTFEVSLYALVGRFKGVVSGSPIFSSEFHTGIGAVVFGEPNRTTTQVASENREPLLWVSDHAVVICDYDTGNNK